MIKKKVNVNRTDYNGWTALMLGIKINQLYLFKYLLNYICIRYTIQIASMNGWTEVIQLLIENGANIYKKNNDGDTALLLGKRSYKICEGFKWCLIYNFYE